MRLLNAAVAVASAVAGTVGASAAYGALNTPPVGHTEPLREPVTLTHYLPCEPPSTLKDGVCVTTVVKKVVRTPASVVITTVQTTHSTKGKSHSTKAPTRHDDDHEDEDEDDHGHEDGED
jgi:hypothetical protein